VAFTWAVPASRSTEARKALSDAGATLDDRDRPFEPPPDEARDYAQAGFEPLTVIAGAMGLVLLAERVADFIRSERDDGLIIDARSRTETLDVRTHPRLKGGRAMVVTDDGAEMFDTSSELASAITALRS